MRKLFNSSFFVLSLIAIVCGSIGAILSGMWDLTPPTDTISYGNFFDGAGFGAALAAIGLIPYWIFHIIIGDASDSWEELENRKLRIIWVVFWATTLGLFFSLALSV